MTSQNLLELIERSSTTEEAIWKLAVEECALGGECFVDPDFLLFSHWHSVWAPRLRRMGSSDQIHGMKESVLAFAANEGTAQCVNLTRKGRTVFFWFNPERELKACIACKTQG